ncbi:MAG TPA: SpoIID/LytB domain-containing protein [Myxococcales bacterium]|nr:SpoIID/LytB domain-containing protein [Myxococcales bacterium]
MLALLLHVQILGLLHPQRALVDGVEAVPGHRYGGEKFTVQVGELKRTYAGALQVEDGGSELKLINEVELEDYVAAVVAAELAEGPPSAREALAIVARTYALSEPALDDTAHTQWYRGLERADIEAARRTRGQVLVRQGKIAPVAYSQDCGGSVRETWRSTDRSPDTHAPGTPRGRGHGVGLCQRGALFLASKGASAHQILARYFPSLQIGRR